MKKKTYSKPTLSSEQFTPQEFVAACEHPEFWSAQCCQYADRGYVFFDYNNDGIIEEEDLHTEGEHGGCHQEHTFIWETDGAPGYNAWVLKQSTINANPRVSFWQQGQNQRVLRADRTDYLVQALVKRPHEALDDHWLVCYNLNTLKNPS